VRISITNPNLIPIAVKHFQEGSIVIFPTDTSYGLGTIGLKSNEKNIKQIFEIKSRPFDKPLSLLITKKMVTEYIQTTPQIQDLLEKIWPGRITVVFSCNEQATHILSPLLNLKTPWKIAFRVPKHRILLKIIERVGSPIIGTSANKTGTSSIYDHDNIYQDIIPEDIHLSIDAGKLPQNPPSTIVDMTDPANPILLRKGEFNLDDLF
jgi:L-threonylcarbamoyladenylate synthase